MITKVLVEQEYGWKYWLWTSNGTFEEMKEHFRGVIKKKGTEYSCNSPEKDFGGKWEELDYDRYREYMDGERDLDGWAHVHEYLDSKIHKPI